MTDGYGVICGRNEKEKYTTTTTYMLLHRGLLYRIPLMGGALFAHNQQLAMLVQCHIPKFMWYPGI